MAMKLIKRNEVFSGFFDRQAVTRSLDQAKLRNFGRIGAFAMKVARRSMRPGGRRGIVSAPGDPPRWHTKLLRDNIFFSYDRAADSVVIGPALLNRTTVHNPSGMTVPELLEFGGDMQILEYQTLTGFWYPVRKFVPADRPSRLRRSKMQPRPYMGPALDKTLAKQQFQRMWRDSLRPAA